MVGRNRHEQLDRLIEEVSRGERELSSIRDVAQREAVRIALRLHSETADQPDAYAKIRMRARVMGRLDTRRATVRDHAWAVFELLARPAPYITRSVVVASLLLCLGMGVIVASADTLPDDVLYPMKLSAEAVRLALADTPSDRAVIETSIAEHRLHEAERLATSGRTTDALVASAMYSQHIAWAAAELAPNATSDLARQLESRFDADRGRAQALATALASNASSAGAARVLEMIATSTALRGETGVVRVASTAAEVVEQLVQVAEETASNAEAAEDRTVITAADATSVATLGAARLPETRASGNGGVPTEETRPQMDGAATATARGDAKRANDALRTVRKAAERTRAAVDRAKSGRQ